ncbi:regulation of nuclear pre-mRNA domain-containing protein 2 [Biomphalaria glabrata]|uniref:Regulation of nuclear pre-mRNA domain-containing protein 2 n=1 Tax=Biomphalaria glabrata TaxID=6526 RepID=A0A2C9JNG7_BIOGL|nr:regulation of nuclear pre-mRNA domain-containing protein 2-like [Biomphalaria glabrata]XP_055878306.1 regulation of nuclear pre-mRNA domain-containing protein 2-like [Biomphalaria glabrata]XP_055878315.1 regulation of nuclear pre-mRNA domain-containing protein 2-like [Biomphalaria glabrata]KAI8755800.1 regulation of nuclear pre-mRNA domain-containing protein 2-like [Biomphalaria glabrata]
MASTLNEESVEKKLKTVNNTQDSIQSLSLWIIHHKSHHAKIVELWMKVLKKTVQPSHRLTLFYLCNDVVQTCKKKKAFVYNTTFKEHLKEAASLVRDHSVKGKIERIFNIWGERNVYDTGFIKSLIAVLNGQSFKKAHSKVDSDSNNGPISPVGTPFNEFELKEVASDSQNDSMTEKDAEESARILAEFKPHEMIEQITAFRRQETDIKFRVSQLSHLKLDASSIEAVKQLKDRAHGNDFSSQFEDSCTKLEDLVKRQTQHLQDQKALLEILNTSETFYEEQYREAKIVANAYKNFGARINNMKKKLDELKMKYPAAESPIPSPDINAPSPGNTPPHISNSGYMYNPASSMMNYDSTLNKNTWNYNGTNNIGISVLNSANSDNTFQDSPPLEAPSPEGSPPDLNLDGSQSASVSLDSRLASFFDRNRNSSNPPVYTPQISRSLPSSNKFSKLGEEDGSATPLDDETPTTPVQDEHLASPPKSHTPPKKEKPIDFLSRLISQTQKAPLKTGPTSFLDSIPLLTGMTKKADSVNPQAWTPWKANPNDNSTIPSLSSPTYGPAATLATSPNPYPTPTMVPPPIPLPVPPPSISLGMSLSMPPPPPPPFSLTTVLHQDYMAPPLGFQQTSPGQKENWPELGHSSVSDHSSVRPFHNSVLKELVPADSFDSKTSRKPAESSSSHMESDAMEIVSDEEDESLGSHAEASEAKTEFAQKLKQKTLAQGSVKSHVFVPNPERPNLVTLAAQDDLDEEDMIDDNTVVEDNSDWPSKSHKSAHKSRSRSHSKEKDRSHKHKKKKKHKRNHSDEDEPHLSDDDSKGISSLGSVVKKIESRSSSRNSRDSIKGDKYEEERKFDRKYERCEDRPYGSRGDYKSQKSLRGSKDPVEAYTQAYRDAFFQQYSQSQFSPFPSGPGPMDPRTRYRKY